jgi:hypothetical protein
MVAFSVTSPPTATAEVLQLLNPGLVGISTGYMAQLRGNWPQLLSSAAEVSRDAVELSALSARELPSLVTFLSDRDAQPFSFNYVSIHGPAKGWTATPAELAVTLDVLLSDRVAGIVMHPETLHDVRAFARLGRRLLLENMDTRKRDGRTVDELAGYFGMLPEASFCFDIAHAYLVDPSLVLANELLDAYGDRLREVHVSSILPDGRHVTLASDDLDRFRPTLVRCVGVPWILEAAPGSV